MSWLSNTLGSSLGRKLLMSLTGLFLVSFLAVHLSGNFLLLKDDGGAAFNLYSHFMSTAGIIRVLEIGLVLGFLGHIYNGIVLTQKNKAARPVQYAVNNASENSSFFSRFMPQSGIIVLFFLVLHLKTFYFEYHYGAVEMVMIDGVEYKNMYLICQLAFAQLWYLGVYLVAFLLLGFHLNHGIQSAFQTLGVNHPKYSPFIKQVGTLLAIALCAGFAFIAVAMYMQSM